jgi:hypothetical protein
MCSEPGQTLLGVERVGLTSRQPRLMLLVRFLPKANLLTSAQQSLKMSHKWHGRSLITSWWLVVTVLQAPN